MFLSASKMRSRKLDLAEWCLAILLTFVVLFLLFVRARHAGALWRDECASVQVAATPNLHGLFENFQRESFPAFFYLILRAVIWIFGRTDAVFRSLGFT